MGLAGDFFVTAEHDPSEIELALLDQAVELVLAEWCNNWAGVEELTPSLLGHETSGQFMHTASHDAMMLVLAMEAKVGDCTEQIHLAMPCSALEPLIHKLNQATTSAAEETPRLPAAPLKWNRNFDEVPVPVTAIWDDLVLTAREVANLKPGDILPLDPRTTRQVTLRLADTPRFQGSLGTTSGKWAVAVTSVMKGALNP